MRAARSSSLALPSCLCFPFPSALSLFECRVSELLAFYRAYPVKEGWGKLKRPVTRQQFEKELAVQAGRSNRGSSPTRAGAGAIADNKQTMNTTADATVRGSETVTGEVRF